MCNVVHLNQTDFMPSDLFIKSCDSSIIKFPRIRTRIESSRVFF